MPGQTSDMELWPRLVQNGSEKGERGVGEILDAQQIEHGGRFRPQPSDCLLQATGGIPVKGARELDGHRIGYGRRTGCHSRIAQDEISVPFNGNAPAPIEETVAETLSPGIHWVWTRRGRARPFSREVTGPSAELVRVPIAKAAPAPECSGRVRYFSALRHGFRSLEEGSGMFRPP